MMSVEIDVENGVLAGSEPINSTLGGSTDTETPLNDPEANAGQDGPVKRSRGRGKPKPGRLVLICARCNRAIAGSGAGYAYVDLRDCHKAAQRTAGGYLDPAKARWSLSHRGCAPEALAPMSPHHVVWAETLYTVDALLDAMVRLSFSAWFAWSDWGALARDILAATETAAIDDDEATVARRAERNAARAKGLPPGDQRHGTAGGYRNYGCRCDECREGNAAYERSKRAAKNQGLPPGDHRHGTLGGYDYWGCRCDDCKQAKSQSHRAQYAASKAAQTQENER